MTNLERGYDELVGLCYESVLNADVWPLLLGRLAQLTGWQRAVLLFWQRDHSCGQAANFYQMEPSSIEDYNRYYCQLDPTHSFMRERAVGDWYYDVQELGIERIRRDPYYQEYNQHYGMKNITVVKLAQWQGSDAFLSVILNQDAPLPNAYQQYLRQRLTPHLLRAAHLANLFSNVERELSKRDLLLDQHPTPLWLVESDGQLVFCNSAAERRMQQAECSLYLKLGRLHCRIDETRWQYQLREAAKDRAARASRLSVKGQQLLITPVAAGAAFNRFFQKPLVLIALLEPCLPQALLAELFQLSPAEQRLAQLLCQGLSPELCADQLKVSINTVRSQLRALFRKTDTERQAELVSLFVRMQQS